MKWQRLTVVLTMLNFVLLAALMAQLRPVSAAPEVMPLLRVRALELVDEQGRVRADLKVFPAQQNLKMPDGTIGFPEAVQLRLIDETGSPHIKLGTQKNGSGLLLGGLGGYLQLYSRGTKYVIKIVPNEHGGHEQIVASADRTTSDSK
jgi:hypothetical protein